MEHTIYSRVIETVPVRWRELLFLQADNFKEWTPAAKEKLKSSVISNDFTQPFYVWKEQETGNLYCLDGRHRHLILEELISDGVSVPDELPATFLRCANKKEAAALVLQYSSIYARIAEQGLLDFLSSFDLEFDAVKMSVDFPEFDLLDFESKLAAPGETESVQIAVSLAERFIVPPFSVLDTRQGYWQDRKRQWHALGISSQETREDVDLIAKSGQGTAVYELRNKMRASMNREPTWEEIIAEANKRGMHIYEGASIFDPVLCELMYTWFCPAGDQVQILDTFAGGSVRGIVAGTLGYNYWGIDLRSDQVEANKRQWEMIGTDKCTVIWETGDSNNMLDKMSNQFDFVFTCPPYHDLEQYSDDPADLSNMPYAQFLDVYRSIIHKSVEKLKDNRFACFVVGDIRDKSGAYRDFVGDTVQAFRDTGMMYYNEIILINVAGSMPIRVGRQFESGRKVGKTHQNVLVFFKGDPATIKDNYPVLPVAELEVNDTIPEGVEEL